MTTFVNQSKNKIVSVITATILMMSLFFGVAPMSVFATSNTNSFTYNGSSHNVTISGQTVEDVIVAEIKSAGSGFLHSSAVKAVEELKLDALGETSADALNAKFTGGVIGALKLIGISFSLEGEKQVNAGTYNVSLKFKIGKTEKSIVVASYTINPAPLTIIAGNIDAQEGKEIPESSYTYSVGGTFNSEDAQVTGTPSYTTSFDLSSVAGEKDSVTPAQGTLAVANGNYTLVGATYVNGEVTVIDLLTAKNTFALSAQSPITYTATAHTADAILTFVEAAQAALKADATTDNDALETIIAGTEVSIIKDGVPANDITAVGTYTLSTNIKGDANIGEFEKYDYTFTQTVEVVKVDGVEIFVNSFAGSYPNTFEVFTADVVPAQVVAGFYVVLPVGTSTEAVNEVKASALTIKEIKGLLTNTLTVDVAPISNNFNVVKVHEGTSIAAGIVDGIIEGVSEELVKTVSAPLNLPYDLGTFNKTYDGKALANIEGEALTQFSNDVLNEVLDALNSTKAAIEGSNMELPTNVTVPGIPESINIAGLNIDLTGTYVKEINSVISKVNGLLSDINNGVANGVSTAEDVLKILETFGNGTIALKVTPTNELTNVVNVGDTSTVTLSLEVSFSITMGDLINIVGDVLSFAASIPGINDMYVTIPVSIDVAKVSFGVNPLPVTIYQSGVASYDNNGGVFYKVAPEIINAQLTSDYYVAVDTLNYLLLSEGVKAELSSDILTDATTHTLGANYSVTIKDMTEDAYYGEIAKEIKDAVSELQTEVNDLIQDLADAKQKLEDIKDTATQEYKELQKEIEELTDRLNAKLEELQAKKEEVIQKVIGKYEYLTKVFEVIVGQIEGIDMDSIKEALKDYASQGIDELEERLKEEAKELALELMKKAYEELEKLGLDEKAAELKALAIEELNKAIALADETFPITADLGTATKDYNNSEFTVDETGVVADVLAQTATLKSAISSIDVDVVSNTVVFELIESQIPADVKDTYTDITNTLQKLGLDVSDYEAFILAEFGKIDALTLEAENVLNVEIQKLVGEVKKVEDIISPANQLTVTELKTVLEALDCDYIKVVVEGNVSNKDTATELVTIKIFSTLFKTEYQILELTANLEIEAIELDVTVDNQTIAHNAVIAQDKFTITSNVDAAIQDEANAAIELVADTQNDTITAQIKSGVVNFVLANVTEGTLTVTPAPTTSPSTGDGDTTGGGTTTTTPAVAPALPVIPGGTEIEDPEVPQGDAGEILDEEETDSEVVIEEPEAPLSSGDDVSGGSSMWMLALGALLALFLIFFLLKRRKEEEEEVA